MFDMFDVMDSVFPILFGLVFCLVMGMFIYAIVHNVKEKRANDAAPVLTVEALVKTKRMDTYHTSPTYDGDGHRTSSGSYHTSYYATFEVESLATGWNCRSATTSMGSWPRGIGESSPSSGSGFCSSSGNVGCKTSRN